MRRDDGSDDDGGLLGELGGLVLKILRHGATVLAGGGKVIVAISVVTAMVGGLVGVQTVDPGERGVYVRNGEVMGTVTNGVHPTIPLIDRVRVFNMRTTTFSTTQDALTNDNINVNVSVTVRWDIRDGELERVYRDQAVNQEQLIELAVRDAVTSGIKESRKFDSDELSSEAYRDAVLSRISELFTNRGLVVKSVTINNIRYPGAVEKKFQQQKQAQAQLKIEQNKLEAVKVQNQRELENARNRREVIRTRSAALSDEYIRYIQAKQIDETDTVYVVPRDQSTTVENTIDANATA